MNTQTPKELLAKKQAQNILIVGAGGIGCELIKLLFKTTHNITLMDFDTVSESNLNRQFCFRKKDVGRYKVDVLFSYFNKINPNFKLKCQKGNLFQYNSLFFTQFDILISALDNRQARQHLNQIAIDYQLALIDAGTSGYNGQAQCFHRYISQCRMCRPQQIIEDSLAVCSLRDRPQKNIHCIHFALNLLESIHYIGKFMSNSLNFSKKNEYGFWETILKYFQKGMTNTQVLQAIKLIHNEIFYNILAHNQHQQCYPIRYDNGQSIQIFTQYLIKKGLACINIKRQITSNQIIQFLENIKNQELLWQKCFPNEFYSYLFVTSMQYLLQIQSLPQSYDKDHFASSLFVFSATNLRISNFKNSIGSKLTNMSYYECKDTSGKIIPALASTNSMAAALQICFLHSKMERAYISIKGAHSQNKIQKYVLQKPKQGCPYCSRLYNYVQIYANMKNTNWGELQQFLIENFDDSFKQRDLRCKEFIIIRNTGFKKLELNKTKPLNFNPRLLQISKNGYQIMTLKYIPIKGKFYSSWKFLVTNFENDKNKFMIKKGLQKQEYRQRIQNQLEKIQILNNLSMQN